MDKYFAFLFACIGVVYTDLGSDSLFYGFLVPAVFLIGICYLLTIPGFLIFSGAAITFYFIDVDSSSVFEAVMLPLLFMCWFFLFVVWAWSSGHPSRGAFWGSQGLGDGDCGAGGDGCGSDGGGG